MKRTAKLIVCMLLVLCTLLTFAACKKKGKNDQAAQSEPTASIYYLAGATYGDTTYTLDQLWIDDPAQNYIFFDVDNTGFMCLDYAEYYFEYADGQLWHELEPDTKINYILTGDALTLEQDGYKLVFTKGELPDWAIADESDEVTQENVEETPEEETPEEETPEEETPAPTEATTATEAATEATTAG